MLDTHVELNRTFHEISLNGGDSDEYNIRNLRFGKGLNWQDLLAGYRTVILSEAGSGKTEEIRHSTIAMRKENKPAFFLRLEHVSDDFEIAFEEGTHAEFEQWLASDKEGWLFLDSVDEARLRDPTDFERAIRKIGVRFSTALQRTHIVLTSRGHAWRPVTDLKLCQKHLAYKELNSDGAEGERKSINTAEKQNPFKIVAIDDLVSGQVSAFASAIGVADTMPFLQAIERADAWSMAARPDDLIELVEFWNENKRIGNRLELMRSSIARRLVERDQNRSEFSPLSQVDAMSGVQSIAAAATLAQEATIRVPDGTENAKGIPVASVLPGWDDKKCAALLARPIFDEAIYQTVRFHHRTVREYLTAMWFKGLLDRETSRRKVEALFFREQYGQDVIVPVMRSILVWLLLFDEKIRERALEISPKLIFEGGEPKALPLKLRRRILRDVCQKMHADVGWGAASDYRAVQRFADKDIAADVKALIVGYAMDDEIKGFLLRMVWLGELSHVLPEANQIALDHKAERYVRIAAFRAVRAVGSETDKLEVRKQFQFESSELSRDWFAELLDELPPTSKSVAWLLACIAKLKPKGRHTVDRLPYALDTFIGMLDPDLVAEVLKGLNALIIKQPVVERRYCEISEQYGWLIKCAAKAAERLIVARHAAALAAPTLSVIQKLPVAQQFRDWNLGDIESEIPKLVPAWREVNDALFWFEVGEARRFREKKEEPLTEIWQVSMFRSYWQFKVEDFDRVLSDVERRPLEDDRLIVLSLAFQLYVSAGRPRQWREMMKAKVKATPILDGALHRHLHPPPRTESNKSWKRQEANYKRRQKEREAITVKHKQEWQDYIETNIGRLRDPGLADKSDVSSMQYYLHEKVREHDPQSGCWSYGNWQALEDEFGVAAAKAFRDGVVAYWRHYKPRLRSEGRTDNSTPLKVIFGLTGLNIEARETEDWASKLDEREAEIAFRYSMEELNGFPEWMPSLFGAFPSQISTLLLVEVDRDLRAETTKAESHYVLSDLSWSGSWAWSRLGKEMFARLKTREPKNLKNLGYMLNIVHGSDVCAKDIARLAESRSADRRLAHASRWFAVWAGVEPGRAISGVKARLATIKSRASQTIFAMQFITALLGGRRSESKNGDAFRTPEHLKTLYILMHQYIREVDDIHRAGTGVYSPGLRDDAQDARNNLFSLLKEIPGKESYLALMELARLHPEPSSRPWTLHHAKTKAEADADLDPWTIQQTLEFQSVMERTPANHRELFELAEMRFLDLKDSLEDGDSSVAEILRKGATQETDMRKYIGDWCRDRAQSRYSIPQEEELADAKKPDLRFHGMGFDGQLPIELKLADKNWSGPKLFERLENQLCGDYLRDNRSRRGLFVLVNHGEKKNWELPGQGKPVAFAGLVAALQAHWQDISEKFPNIDDIRVIGIDLTLRHKNSGKNKPESL